MPHVHRAIKAALIQAGVSNLKEFGYQNVNKDNILTTDVYKGLFLSMLNENLGSDPQVNKAIRELIDEVSK